MIDYESYEKDEIIKPRHVTKKPRTKKSDHKHQYRTEIKTSSYSSAYMIMVEICEICGREGDVKMLRNDA
jgi:hypothetical protein